MLHRKKERVIKFRPAHGLSTPDCVQDRRAIVGELMNASNVGIKRNQGDPIAEAQRFDEVGCGFLRAGQGFAHAFAGIQQQRYLKRNRPAVEAIYVFRNTVLRN
jgi:hypothetical protein